MAYIYTSESVSAGHPDKVADQISDAILDNYLAYDNDARVACETLVTTGLVVLAGEMRSMVGVDIQRVVRDTILNIGYDRSEYGFDGNSCGIFSAIHAQSPDIARGVDGGKEQGAGDQGIMFGYAVRESPNFMPLPIYLSHLIVRTLDEIRREKKVMTYLRPDAKSQVSVRYSNEGKPVAIDTVVISTQHDAFLDCNDVMRAVIERDIRREVFTRMKEEIADKSVAAMLDGGFLLIVNPAGQFVTGGPHGDTGLTGRKIVVDAYGGRGSQGGGCQSGKDPSKVDRSAFYMARYVAKNMVAAGVSDEVLVQLSYAIGKAEPVSIFIDTYGRSKVGMDDGEIAKRISALFDFKPKSIAEKLKLCAPIYLETAAYGQVGQENRVVTKTFHKGEPDEKTLEVDIFTWEKLDSVEILREAFGLVREAAL